MLLFRIYIQGIVHAALCYTIAEGIETKGDSEKINHIGIHLHQGWYHGRPMSAEKSRSPHECRKITAYTV
ncbi:hypothetical protein [Marinomonas primoryensis]|uniref:EAL domain-containing protein n=1 Tax=Marinomonas primoryensis TaxID=178399 RepID=A0ABV0L093_9GAMM